MKTLRGSVFVRGERGINMSDQPIQFTKQGALAVIDMVYDERFVDNRDEFIHGIRNSF